MCGLAAVWSPDPIADHVTLADRLDGALAHRGPDGHASRLLDAGRLLLVHRRLAIIEPTLAGAQPMSTPDGRFTIVFNGEIYNHATLRCRLERAGERFATRSDTEVMLRGLARSGPDALVDVRGMFALTLWDAVDRTLLIARDRFGIKPLYVATERGRLGVASEIGALRITGFGRDVDVAGVLSFLEWGTVPAPLTWRTGIEALEPGTWRRYSTAGVRCQAFADVRRAWTTVPISASDRSDAEFKADVAAAVDVSVRHHLVADVPVGVFLSAGVDSVAITARAREYCHSLQAFTVGGDDRHSDETAAAASIAKELGVAHQIVRVDSRDAYKQVLKAVSRLDQPTLDGINTFVVASAVARTGIRAVLSGTGGDELFGGYPSFRRIPRARLVCRAWTLGAAIAKARALMAPPGKAARWRALAASHGEVLAMYRVFRGLFMPLEIDQMIGSRVKDANGLRQRPAVLYEQRRNPVGDETIHASIARLETMAYLSPQLLRDTDVASMAHGLEVRVPFVDADVVAAVWPELGNRPHLLDRKRLLRDILDPPSLRALVAKSKRTFTLPMAAWIRGPLAEFTREALRGLETEEWITAGYSDTLWKQFATGGAHWSRVWALGVLGHYVSRN